LQQIEQIPKSKIAYIDETGIDAYLCREHCWSLPGQKIVGYVSGKKYRRIGIVAAKMGKNILAPLQYDGTMDSVLFEAWFEKSLMCELPADTTIVMDNASFHRKARLISLAEKHGHQIIFLPPYSPELNPIENFWAWLKSKLRNSLCSLSNFDDALYYCFNFM